jgi:hypothetical protein
MKNAFETSGGSPPSNGNIRPRSKPHSKPRSKPLEVPADILVENYGSILLLRPVSSAGQLWLDENCVSPETQTFGGAVVCEPRYVANVVFGARGEGLVVR